MKQYGSYHYAHKTEKEVETELVHNSNVERLKTITKNYYSPYHRIC